jgi:hypothetical protein
MQRNNHHKRRLFIHTIKNWRTNAAAFFPAIFIKKIEKKLHQKPAIMLSEP